WFEAPNPNIAFEQTPFYVAADKLPWPRRDVARLAGVSAFGVGGTNAHVIVEEAPVVAPRLVSPGPRLFFLSARSESSLQASCDALATQLDAIGPNDTAQLADVAFT